VKKLSRKFKFVVLLLTIILIWIFAAPRLAEGLIVEKPLARADAIFVLSGSSVYVERAQKAAELYKQGISDKILLTDDGARGGWSQTERRNPPFAELAKNELIRQSVRAENIEILDEKVSGTIDEARILRKIAGERNLKSILLVTSAYHSRRVLRTFEKAFAETGFSIELGIAPAPTGVQTPPPALWWLSPFGWQTVAGEYVKSFLYWVYY
jgi:uncharacterized SAM-binding protein YcdF (DUF218 family)